MIAIDVQIRRLIFPSFDHANSPGIIPSFQLVNDHKNTRAMVGNDPIQDREELDLPPLDLFGGFLSKHDFTFKVAIWNVGGVMFFLAVKLDDLKDSSIAS